MPPPPPTIVFIHFFGGSARSWDGVVARLGAAGTLALDLPGFGAAADSPGPFDVSAYADFVQAKVRAHGLTPDIIVGHSMGGKVALALAARMGADLGALVLVAPSPPSPEPIDGMVRACSLAGWSDRGNASRTLAAVTARPLPPSLIASTLDDIVGVGRAAWNAWLESGSREDITADMERITAPVTILAGARDKGLPADLLQREVADRLRRSTLASIAGAGHLLPLEAPDEVAEAVARVRAALRVEA